MSPFRDRRKSAIHFLERESAEWKRQVDKELSKEETREVGKVRAILLADCLKTLQLLKKMTS
jgi:hypothetical protein